MTYGEVMDGDTPSRVHAVFENRSGFARADRGFEVTTTTFDGVVTASEYDGPGAAYTVTVTVPTLTAATADEVGDAVAADWLRTLRRRLEDAPSATRARVDLDSFAVETDGDEVHVEYEFTRGTPGEAADIATSLVEFAEGTYVEGIVPGYEYEPPVSGLLSNASQGGESGTPL